MMINILGTWTEMLLWMHLPITYSYIKRIYEWQLAAMSIVPDDKVRKLLGK